jgi:phage repressor protein C with HTH and peptisase S24 domain
MSNLDHGEANSVKLPILSTVFLPNAYHPNFGKNTGMLEEVLRRIHERLEIVGLSESAAAKRAGLSADAIRNMRREVERGNTERGASIRTLSKLAPVLETTAEYLLSGIGEGETGWSTVKGVGYIGAGAQIEPDFEQVPPEGLFTVDVPFAVPEDIIALGVKGDSMMPRYDDGDVILVYKEAQRAPESLLGEEVAVRTSSGHRYLKRLMRGASRRHFNLESWNARTIEDVELEWVGEIYLTVRAGQIRRIEAKERAAASRRRAKIEAETAGMDELPLEDRKAS